MLIGPTGEQRGKRSGPIRQMCPTPPGMVIVAACANSSPSLQEEKHHPRDGFARPSYNYLCDGVRTDGKFTLRREQKERKRTSSDAVADGLTSATPLPGFKALRRQPSQQRGARRINDVLDAAERLLKKQHFDSITIENVAEEAQIQIGSLYHFFESKTAILLSVLERQLQA